MNKRNLLSLLLLMIVVGTKAQINIIDLNAVFQSDSIDQARLVVQYEMKYVKDTTDARFIASWIVERCGQSGGFSNLGRTGSIHLKR